MAWTGEGDAYVVLDASEVTDPELFKHYLPKTAAAMTSAGGRYIVIHPLTEKSLKCRWFVAEGIQ